MHGCKMIDSMEAWKSEVPYIRSRCGFCSQYFNTWADRCDHLAKHFRAGARMRDWKGCRGFDGRVAALVTNAMPPYLIGNEANSMIPFSASNEASMTHGVEGMQPGCGVTSGPLGRSAWDQFGDFNLGLRDLSTLSSLSPPGENMNLDGPIEPLMNFSENISDEDYMSLMPPPQRPGKISSCWEVLTVRLGLFVKERLRLGDPITNEMLQGHARWILYESDDQWNQTAADNPEWLELFKKAHGLPSLTLDETVDPMEDLGMLGQTDQVGDMSFDSFFQQDHAWDNTANNLNLGGLSVV